MKILSKLRCTSCKGEFQLESPSELLCTICRGSIPVYKSYLSMLPTSRDNPLTDTADLTDSAYWDKEWQRSTKRKSYNPKKPFQLALGRLFQAILPSGHHEVLEVGVGASVWLEYMETKLGYTAFGIDYSPTGCEQAVENFPTSTNRDPRIILGDAFQPPLASNSFDIVYSLGVAEHFTQPEPFLDACLRLVRPNGLLLTTIPNKRNLGGRFEARFNSENYRRHNAMRLEQLVMAHRNLGLSIEVAKYFGPITLSSLPDPAQRHARTLTRIHRLLNRCITQPLHATLADWPRSPMTSSFIAVLARKPATS